MQIVWLEDAAARDAALVGGKAAALSRFHGEFTVPGGFCLTAEPPPANWREAVAAAYEELARRAGTRDPKVAVRSSAVDEDGAHHSFAGVHETVLDVSGTAAVAEAIERCWASARSERAAGYRQSRGLPPSGPMAILVQLMVQAEASAVGFSVDPVTGAGGSVVIDAARGLGEPLVGGTATPDRYVVDKVSGAVTGPVSGALTNIQAKALADLVKKLEELQGAPVDVEASFAGATLFLLQCRPVTTPPDSDEPFSAISWNSEDDARQTWFGGGVPVKPLQQSMSLHYYQGWAKAFRALRVRGGLRARFDRGFEYRHWAFVPEVTWDEFGQLQTQAARDLPERWSREWLPRVQADLAAWKAVDLSRLTPDQLAVHAHGLLSRQLEHWEIHAHLGSLPLHGVQRLIDWYLARFPESPESEPYRLLQGQENTSVENNRLLWALSRRVTAEIAWQLERGEWDDLPSAFRAEFEAYLERFFYARPERRKRTAILLLGYAARTADPAGDREALAAEAAAFVAEVSSRLSPDERPVFDELLSCALANHPLTENHAYWLDGQSDAATLQVVDEFARRLKEAGILAEAGDVDYLTLSELLQWGFGRADPLGPLAALRKAEHAASSRLNAPRFIGAPPPPPEAGGWVDRFQGPSSPLEASESLVRGVGASAGKAEGTARVVKTLEEAAALKPGEILVCPATTPDWTPFFGVAAALVTDSGGSLSHAAVVAREYRLPAVVGTHLATAKIVTGQTLEVDGLSGTVKMRT